MRAVADLPARTHLLRASRQLAPAWVLALPTLLLCAVALRIVAGTLGRENFWLDELSSLYFSDPARSIYDTVREIWRGETNPPLYYVYLYLWRHIVPGADEASIRAASLIPAALACASPLFYPSRVMSFERRLAVVLLLSFSPGLLYYAGEARGYGLALFFSVNMCFLMLSALQTLRADSGGLVSQLGLLGVFSAAAAWTHLFGTLLAAVFFLILVAASVLLRRRILTVALAAVLTGAAVTIWPLAHLAYMNAVAGDHWFISLSRESVMSETKWIGHLAFGHRLSVLAFGGLTVAALAFAWRPLRSGKTAFYLSLPLLVGLVLGLSIGIPIYYGRYFMVALPVIYILVAEAVGDAGQRAGAPEWLSFAVLLVLSPLLMSEWPVLQPPEREDWRAPANVVNAMPSCAGAPIFVLSPGRDTGDPAYLYRHYLDRALDVDLVPILAGERFAPGALARVWRSPCPVKVWGSHVELWQLRALDSQFAGFPSGFSLRPFRGGFLLLAGGAEQVAGGSPGR